MYISIYIIGVSEGKEREKGNENVFEKIMAKDFPNLKKKKQITRAGNTKGHKQDGP